MQDDVWDRRQVKYVVALLGPLGFIFAASPYLPPEILLAFAAAWGAGSVGGTLWQPQIWAVLWTSHGSIPPYVIFAAGSVRDVSFRDTGQYKCAISIEYRSGTSTVFGLDHFICCHWYCGDGGAHNILDYGIALVFLTFSFSSSFAFSVTVFQCRVVTPVVIKMRMTRSPLRRVWTLRICYRGNVVVI